MASVYLVYEAYDNNECPEDRIYNETIIKAFSTLNKAERFKETVKPNGDWTEGFPPEADPDYMEPDYRYFYHVGKWATETMTYWIREMEVDA